jgi:hypothetical protein
MPFLDELAGWLVGAGVGVLNHDIFVSSAAIVPPGDGPYLILVETGGSGSSKTQNNTATENPTAQISCRAKKYAAARTMLNAAYEAFGGANGVYNVSLGGTFYLKVTARQNPTDVGLDGAGRAMVAYNVDAERGAATVPPTPPFAPATIFQLIEDLGGDSFAFVNPAVADQYLSGAAFDKLVPDSVPVLLNAANLYAGSYYLEASARVATTGGARAKVGIFDLTNAPDVPLVEIAFAVDEQVGERKRSAAFTIPSSSVLLGVKVTVDSLTIGAAAWGCRIVRA